MRATFLCCAPSQVVVESVGSGVSLLLWIVWWSGVTKAAATSTNCQPSLYLLALFACVHVCWCDILQCYEKLLIIHIVCQITIFHGLYII